MRLRTEQSTTQTLSLSQQQIQSLHILSLTSAELEKYLEELAWENPLVEIGSPGVTECIDYAGGKLHSGTADEQGCCRDIIDFRDEHCFEEYVFQQMHEGDYDPDKKQLLCYVVSLLDERGYLIENFEEIARSAAVEVSSVEEVVAYLKTLHPLGIGAHSLQECLSIQLKHMIPSNDLAVEIVEVHFEALEKNGVDNLSRLLRRPKEEVLEAFELIRSLNPRPRSGLDYDQTHYIIPDVVVKLHEGNLEVSLGAAGDYKVLINEEYYRGLKENETPEVRAWLDDWHTQARWLKGCIQRRNQMLLAVSASIINHQKAYFYQGPRFFRDVKMGDIAHELGLSISTVSRAVKGKYLQCNWGCVPMRQLFSTTASGMSNGEENVKYLIAELIKNELPEKPLSDQKIKDALLQQNIDVSRRTIARYREELGISSSSKRRYRN